MLFNADVTRACVMQPELSTSHGVAKNKVITTLAMLARILDAASVKQNAALTLRWHSARTTDRYHFRAEKQPQRAHSNQETGSLRLQSERAWKILEIYIAQKDTKAFWLDLEPYFDRRSEKGKLIVWPNKSKQHKLSGEVLLVLSSHSTFFLINMMRTRRALVSLMPKLKKPNVAENITATSSRRRRNSKTKVRGVATRIRFKFKQSWALAPWNSATGMFKDCLNVTCWIRYKIHSIRQTRSKLKSA